MVTLIIVGVLAWAVKEAAEDVIRTWRGEPPPAQRKGFRGYVEDRWNALAERHHRAEESGLITASDARAYKRHLARKEALKRAGFATDEDIARAAAEHRRRMALIDQGIDPDTVPSAPAVPEAAEPEPPVVELEPTGPGVTIDDHFYDNVKVVDLDNTDQHPNPQIEPWDPFKTSNTDTKETHMSNNGEITGPAAVLQFHDDLKAIMDGTTTLVDALETRKSHIQTKVDEVAANLTATENAAAGMRGLGMNDAAEAADALMEIQKEVHDAMLQLRLDYDTAVSALIDQASAAQVHLAAIKAAHDGQLAVQDARAGAGLGNLADDTYLDGND
ncbi:hypothetical protein [Glycomyces sp. NPDC021274]|uniref:hypothetical protein n=1 Tax=Glycomyces sp. NPDC021274 TaxID=3155120 RepID=UPI003410C7BD